MDPSTIAGIWPILYAFFDTAGDIDRSAMRRQLMLAWPDVRTASP